MKKYRDLYEAEKQQYEEALQNYQEDHMDEVEISTYTKGAIRQMQRQKQKEVQKQTPRQAQRQV